MDSFTILLICGGVLVFAYMLYPIVGWPIWLAVLAVAIIFGKEIDRREKPKE